MRARTEDLLTIRDGEPIDAELRERLLADAENLREVQRLTQVAEDLKRLPIIEPPRGAWERIAAAADTRSAAHRRPAYRTAAAAAALLAIAALLLSSPWREEPNSSDTARADGDEAIETVPLEVEPVVALGAAAEAGVEAPADAETGVDAQGDADTDAAAEPDVDYGRLVAESVRLETLLAELAPSPRLMNAGTARTIADLEDRIVLVDAQLMYAEARDADPRYRQALWSERVDVMNALLHVRYAQAQVPHF
jgi:hypothetical protein